MFTGTFDVLCINSINRDTEDLANDNDKISISLFIHFSLFVLFEEEIRDYHTNFLLRYLTSLVVFYKVD